MPCKPPPLGHSFKPTEEVFFERAGPDRKEWFRVLKCDCGETISWHDRRLTNEKRLGLVPIPLRERAGDFLIARG